MDALLLLAIEADKEAKRKSEPVCKMADSVGDVQKAVRNIVQSVHTPERLSITYLTSIDNCGKYLYIPR